MLSLSRRRSYSSSPNRVRFNIQALDDWMASPKQLVLKDTFSPERLSDLFITLPTRDGSRRPYKESRLSEMLGYGSHLAFFHPRTPENLLRPDGTDADFCPPEPFTRRMWAGGRMSWDSQNPLLVGERAISTSRVDSVEKKAFDKGNPMVFVIRKLNLLLWKRGPMSILPIPLLLVELLEMTHRPPVKDVPPAADFSFTFTPSLTTLFRFSALTFNGHHIHLDKDYAQLKEGYPERLVHGPLTALMLLETTMFHTPTAKIAHFEYRARNPVIVNHPITINGAWNDEHTASLWCVNEEGVVGMTGSVHLVHE
ncbi:hypothetical protein B0H10DRAFT_2308442 [Mycena sp. CBHHK59/15]|nr:hypothetical protein B0H10DRAFT_2308442 [Mycena sp. CBHHK59/15]